MWRTLLQGRLHVEGALTLINVMECYQKKAVTQADKKGDINPIERRGVVNINTGRGWTQDNEGDSYYPDIRPHVRGQR
jgi:hypothetical protein